MELNIHGDEIVVFWTDVYNWYLENVILIESEMNMITNMPI